MLLIGKKWSQILIQNNPILLRSGYVNSRQEQYKLDQQLMRELRNGKSYETKWYIVNEIGFGDVAAVDTLLPRTLFKSIVLTV